MCTIHRALAFIIIRVAGSGMLRMWMWQSDLCQENTASKHLKLFSFSQKFCKSHN